MEKIKNSLKSRRSVYSWVGALLILIGLECLVIASQLTKYHIPIKSFRFYYLPVMLTIPMSAIGPLCLNNRSDKSDEPGEAKRSSIMQVAAFSLLIAYITLLVCLGEFL